MRAGQDMVCRLRHVRGGKRDRGALTLELLIVFPSVLLVVLGTLNIGLWFHARNIALAAAQEGVSVARTHEDPGDGAPAAVAFATEAGDGMLLNPAADVTIGDTVDITVTGEAVSLIPGLTLHITQVARAPRERFTSPEDE